MLACFKFGPAMCPFSCVWDFSGGCLSDLYFAVFLPAKKQIPDFEWRGTFVANSFFEAKIGAEKFFGKEENTMLSWSLTFLVIGLIAGVLGLSGLAGAATQIAWILFVVFLVLFLISLIAGRHSPPV